MKYFRVEGCVSSSKYLISKETFYTHTRGMYPYEQKTVNGRTSQYAYCPSCLNPIQIIGLLSIKKTAPHGRHTGKDVEGFPKWIQKNYVFCPYAVKHVYRPPDEEKYPVEIDDRVIELYNLLKNQFDRVVYIVSSELGIRASASFWKMALNDYLENKIYCYPWLTEANLPFVFAFFGMSHNKVYGQRVRVGSNLYDCLCKYPGVDLTEVDGGYALLKNKDGCFVNLYFRFYKHKQHAVTGETLRESMMFCVDDRDVGKNVFEQRIEFDETRFMNLVQQQNETNAKRQQWLLDIANELMPELERTV